MVYTIFSKSIALQVISSGCWNNKIIPFSSAPKHRLKSLSIITLKFSSKQIQKNHYLEGQFTGKMCVFPIPLQIVASSFLHRKATFLSTKLLNQSKLGGNTPQNCTLAEWHFKGFCFSSLFIKRQDREC